MRTFCRRQRHLFWFKIILSVTNSNYLCRITHKSQNAKPVKSSLIKTILFSPIAWGHYKRLFSIANNIWWWCRFGWWFCSRSRLGRGWVTQVFALVKPGCWWNSQVISGYILILLKFIFTKSKTITSYYKLSISLGFNTVKSYQLSFIIHFRNILRSLVSFYLPFISLKFDSNFQFCNEIIYGLIKFLAFKS